MLEYKSINHYFCDFVSELLLWKVHLCGTYFLVVIPSLCCTRRVLARQIQAVLDNPP